MSRVAARLAELGVTLPPISVPVATYIPFVRSGNLIHVSGQIPKVGDKLLFQGKVGEAISLQEAQECAKICITNFLAVVNAAAGGNLDKVKQVCKLNVFVHAVPTFDQPSAVANGASDFIVSVLGDAGRHARSAICVAQLPFGVAVEIDGVVELFD